ncbi:mechanosensitive ion channel family protein [Tichowtungia aerotolerans]|uniref:Mechanosensitive ion channel n=1 Tax=Tichowtungia aerotolerans TaxID=2697043 RepID=A0A6P1M529_9BACT|nr:mechanosensitive ion channel family protein [Tichowtungia aerotolerans]QHI68103.1 mechanosensitive ion channel [Tichowtungia aerotolerans]
MTTDFFGNLENTTFLGNALDRWATACAVAVMIALALWLIRVVGRRWARRELRRRFVQKTVHALTTTAGSISYPFIAAVSAFVGSRVLELSDTASLWRRSAMVMLLIIQCGVWVNAFLTAAVRRYERQHLEQNAGKVTTARALVFMGRIFIVVLVVLAVLDNIPGVDVTTLITGLGIGGIAVALALQNILSDLFASLSISLDRPFSIGDFIIVDNFLGTVDHIGLKTTRIRSLGGEQLIFSNNDLLKSRIRNYKRMEQRRVVFGVGVTYQTPPSKLRKIPDIFKEQLDQLDDVHFDRAHFKAYGAYSLDFEFVYYVHSADYNRYMDIQQAINLGLYEEFEKEGIEFAYPTQTLYMDRNESDVLPD